MNLLLQGHGIVNNYHHLDVECEIINGYHPPPPPHPHPPTPTLVVLNNLTNTMYYYLWVFGVVLLHLQEYSNMGAVIQEDISEASLLIGVKQIPIDTLLPNKTYAFFSHTIKAQEDNMPLLDALLEKVSH